MPIDLSGFNAGWTFSATSGIAATGRSALSERVSRSLPRPNFAVPPGQRDDRPVVHGHQSRARTRSRSRPTIRYWANGTPDDQGAGRRVDRRTRRRRGHRQFAWTRRRFTIPASRGRARTRITFAGARPQRRRRDDVPRLRHDHGPGSAIPSRCSTPISTRYSLAAGTLVFNPPAIATAVLSAGRVASRPAASCSIAG